MAEYGTQDAAAGRPPSKVGRRDAEYMAAYEDEKENQISSREEKFGDALSAMGKGGLNEATQGEMEFQELEAAAAAYRENRRDDEIRHQFGMQVEKLVEPIMSELGFYLVAETFYSRGEIVFESFDPRIDVTIEPAGMMGRYDVAIHPMDESLTFSPIEMSHDTMKGALQFISDTLGETGMVGEPEGQTELPLGKGGISRLPKWRRTAREHKMRITKSQLQQVIREEFETVTAVARPGGGLLEAAIHAYHELSEWLDNPSADENTGRVLDQLAAAINNAGGNV